MDREVQTEQPRRPLPAPPPLPVACEACGLFPGENPHDEVPRRMLDFWAANRVYGPVGSARPPSPQAGPWEPGPEGATAFPAPSAPPAAAETSDGSGDYGEWAERTRASRVRLYETQPLNALKVLCRQRGLAVSGLQHDVATRLVQHDEDVQAAVGTPLGSTLPRLSPRGPTRR